MSLINQMLLDLEKRRASNHEHGLPDHVRALPEEPRSWRPRLIVAGGVAVAAALAAWLIAPGLSLPLKEQSAAVPPPVALPAAVTGAAAVPGNPGAPAVPAGDVPNDDSRPASRLSLELSAQPPAPIRSEAAPVAPIAPARKSASVEAIAPKPAIPAASVVAKATEVPLATPSVPPAASPAADRSPPPAAASAKALAPKPVIEEEKAAAKPAPAVSKPAVVAKPAGPVEIDKQFRKQTPQQQADADYAKAIGQLQQGRTADAREALEGALRQHPPHAGARQTLAALLIETKAYGDAEKVLHEGLRHSPSQTQFAMMLARLQLDRGDSQGALETLHAAAPQAAGNADYLAFHAAVLQRQQRHAEAVDQYQAALRVKQSGVWLMGMGISLQALNRAPEAQDAYKRAQATGTLSPELRAFVDQRMRQLP